ncbi:uncharacterized protein DUF4062 [Williamsia muralis]|uniref:Uncharacterized protein DUF4062 n=1 Tax=Williamsia marianensis TaxID=85044 RepID=A0A495K7R7_WILMA|nr:DUF4062 domain-containing protein [Williamsia muralis]RKR96825.1 uncharacterized protein DUF4062 [Williamsia muralis]
MDRRYQVFVSSTYVDLIEERRQVTQAILELDCIPAGMELFVAADETQWELIRDVIDLSDYYVLIVGGRYGSRTKDGISFTEQEFNYALQQGKHVLAFVHGNTDDIAQGKTDKDDESRELLAKFRSRVMQDRVVADFLTADELGSKVSRALNRAIRTRPGIGWIRGDSAAGDEAEREILRLRAELAEAREQSQSLRIENSTGLDEASLAHGSDEIELQIAVRSRLTGQSSADPITTVTWDDIIQAIGPALIDEATEDEVKEKLKLCAYHGRMSESDIEAVNKVPNKRLYASEDEFEKVVVHLRFLGMIESGTKRRAVSDANKYLRLTPTGQAYLADLMTVKKPSPVAGGSGKVGDPEDSPPIAQTDSPHSTEPTDPAAPEAPAQDA